MVPRAGTPPSSSVSETRTVFAEGSADFLGDLPDRRWATAFPEAGCGVEFTILLAFLVFAYKGRGDRHAGYSLVNDEHRPLPSHATLGKFPLSVPYFISKVGLTVVPALMEAWRMPSGSSWDTGITC